MRMWAFLFLPLLPLLLSLGQAGVKRGFQLVREPGILVSLCLHVAAPKRRIVVLWILYVYVYESSLAYVLPVFDIY